MLSRNLSRFVMTLCCVTLIAACGPGDDNNQNNQSDTGSTADAGDTGDTSMDTADTSDDCSDFDVVIDSNITSDRTLSPDDGCLLVEGEVQIEANLTLEPGVTLYFGENAMFDVYGGSLSAEGTASDPILLTSPTEAAGDWRGIVFRDSATSDNALSYVTLEYAGAESVRAALNFESRPDQPGNGPVEISLDNVTVRQSATRGIAVERATTFNSFANNAFTENEGVPMWAEPVSLSDIDDTNTFTGNGEDVIEIAGMTIENGNQYTWPSLDAPYRLLGSLEVDDGSRLTVEAGVLVKCAEGVYIDVQAGILTAEGTSEAPIVFEGVESNAGYWAGIQYRDTESVDNILSHVTIEHAGGGGLGGIPAGLVINSRASQPGGDPVQISITDVTIRESAELGIYIERNATLEEFDANSFTANEGAPAWIDPRAAVQIGNSSTYTGNGDDVIRMNGLTINGLEGTWMAQDVPYRVEGEGIEIEDSSHITIGAGTEIQFEENLFIEVQNAKLTAAGTSDNPILLTGARDIDGIWYGVQYRDTESVDNRLEHVTIRYAGGGVSSGSADPAALVLNSEQAQPGGDPVAITLDNVAFENVDENGAAVYVEINTTLNGCSNLSGISAAGVIGNGATDFVSTCGL